MYCSNFRKKNDVTTLWTLCNVHDETYFCYTVYLFLCGCKAIRVGNLDKFILYMIYCFHDSRKL